MVRQAAPGLPLELVRRRDPGSRIARLSAVLVTASLAAGLGACASVPRLPGERRDDKLAALEARVLELAQKAAVQEVELARLRQQVASLEAKLGRRADARGGETTGGAGSPSTASVARAVPAPQPPARGAAALASRPAPSLEESELPVEEPVAPPAPAPVAVAPPRPAPARPPAAAPRAALAPGPTAGGGEGEPVSREAQAVYDEAYTFFHQGKYAQAEARFEEFLAQSPKSELSDNAQYWIGASRYARDDFRGALAAFRRTVELYPDGNKVPDALYKMGQALEELAEPVEALAVYDELVRRFPDTAAATLAVERQTKLGH